jgi:hypothetical protein
MMGFMPGNHKELPPPYTEMSHAYDTTLMFMPMELVARVSTVRRIETMAVYLPMHKSHQFLHRYDACQDDKNSDYYSPSSSLESTGDVP